MNELQWPLASTRTRLQLEWLSRQVSSKSFPSALRMEPPTVNESVAEEKSLHVDSPPGGEPPSLHPANSLPHPSPASAQAVIISSNSRADRRNNMKDCKGFHTHCSHQDTWGCSRFSSFLLFFWFGCNFLCGWERKPAGKLAINLSCYNVLLQVS